MTFLMLVLMFVIVGILLGVAMLVLWGIGNHPIYTFLTMLGACVVAGGIASWNKEREERKRWRIQ